MKQVGKIGNMTLYSYKNRCVVVTGFSGFKGSWLTMWLKSLGAKVSGIALDKPNSIGISSGIFDSDDLEYFDISDAERTKNFIKRKRPDLIFHLAAQPIVSKSYFDPVTTWRTNVQGTLNVMEAARVSDGLKGVVIVATDKCYENREWLWGYRENDRLGGKDPYSASKAASEILVASHRECFFNDVGSPLISSARAGNVIGGGDWSQDRLLPDIIRHIQTGRNLKIRYPDATRPWQHVLDCLHGYLQLGERLLMENIEFAQAWNFGPEKSSNKSVSEVVSTVESYCSDFKWTNESKTEYREASSLYLDSTLANTLLNWKCMLDFDKSIMLTLDWYLAWLKDGNDISRKQLSEYMEILAEG